MKKILAEMASPSCFLGKISVVGKEGEYPVCSHSLLLEKGAKSGIYDLVKVVSVPMKYTYDHGSHVMYFKKRDDGDILPVFSGRFDPHGKMYSVLAAGLRVDPEYYPQLLDAIKGEEEVVLEVVEKKLSLPARLIRKRATAFIPSKRKSFKYFSESGFLKNQAIRRDRDGVVFRDIGQDIWVYLLLFHSFEPDYRHDEQFAAVLADCQQEANMPDEPILSDASPVDGGEAAAAYNAVQAVKSALENYHPDIGAIGKGASDSSDGGNDAGVDSGSSCSASSCSAGGCGASGCAAG